MASDRIQKRIERLLDTLEEAADQRDWDKVRLLAEDVLVVDPTNVDAQTYSAAAERASMTDGSETSDDSLHRQEENLAEALEEPTDDPSGLELQHNDEGTGSTAYGDFQDPIPLKAPAEPQPGELLAEAPTPTAAADLSAPPNPVLTGTPEPGLRATSIRTAESLNPIQAIVKAYTHCLDWKARASRSEFWWFYLFVILANEVILKGTLHVIWLIGDYNIWDPWAQFPYLLIGFQVITLVPLLTLFARRLRDGDRSLAWMILVVWYFYWYNHPEQIDVLYRFDWGYRLYHINKLFLATSLAFCAMPSRQEGSIREFTVLKCIGAFVVVEIVSYLLMFIQVPMIRLLDDYQALNPTFVALYKYPIAIIGIHIIFLGAWYLWNKWEGAGQSGPPEFRAKPNPQSPTQRSGSMQARF